MHTEASGAVPIKLPTQLDPVHVPQPEACWRVERPDPPAVEHERYGTSLE